MNGIGRRSKMRRIALTAFGLLVITVASASPVAACYCAHRSTDEAFDVSASVFLGQIVEVSGPREIDVGYKIQKFYVTRFFVWQQWKGAKAIEIEVLFEIPANSCGANPPMKVGEMYMVFADPFSVKQGSPKIQGIVTACSNTYRLSGPNPQSEFSNFRAVSDSLVLDKLDGSRVPLRTPAFGQTMMNKCLCLSY
jgi:hypothetical protein